MVRRDIEACEEREERKRPMKIQKREKGAGEERERGQ